MNMQGIFAILSLCFVASQAEPIFDVLKYGALGDGHTDDSKAFVKAWEDVCDSTKGNPTLLVPKRRTFVLQPTVFQGPCKSPSINFKIQGTISAPKGVNDWKWSSNDKGSWLQFIYINRLVVNGGGVFDGQGTPWWECFRKSRCQRPRAISFHACPELRINKVKVINTPSSHININGCNGSVISNIHLLAPNDSPNTDGLGISGSSHVTIRDSTMEVGDDCVVINGGSYMNISGVFCGPGHGISIGSLGSGGTYGAVEEIHVRNCTFTRSSSGARIKTWEGGFGYVRKVTYEDIILEDVQHPVLITQHYNISLTDNKKAIKISDITYRNFRGTSALRKQSNWSVTMLWKKFDLAAGFTQTYKRKVKEKQGLEQKEVTGSGHYPKGPGYQGLAMIL
ncbi:probable polygalacturonase At3g15720 [Prosopis cineraria]|uniref:probable polygalacturonase At3g15720 n=1 Tax=Prosopis cineraria TaxID=364024 RepID=UPI0024102359|nr:probable polygalacturonase At3g15720 [Prosopis cineraria]